MSDPALFALWLIPLVVIAALGGLALLNRRWRKQAEQELKVVRQALRQMRGEQREIERLAQSYSGRDPEPYRSACSHLRDKLAVTRRKTEEIERRLVGLNERSAGLRANRWRAVLGAPYQWRLLHRDTSQAQRLLDHLQSELALAAELHKTLERLPWDTALELRSLRDQSAGVSQALAGLRDQGLHGDTFEEALRSESQLQASLAQVNRVFLEAGETELLEQSTKDDVALAYQVLQDCRPPLDALLQQSRQWQAGCEAAAQEAHKMRLALDDLAQTLDNLPPALDIAEERAAQRQLEEIARNLHAAAARMEVESLPLISQEAGRLCQTAQETSQTAKRARRELASFETLLSELTADFRDLSLLLAELGARSLHPVEWAVSLEQLAQLNRQANALGNAYVPRTPLKVEQDFNSAADIRARQKELGGHIQEVQTLHAQLTTLLESPEFRAMPRWIQTSRTLGEQVAGYAAENWHASANASALPAEVAALTGEIQRLVTENPGEPLSEHRLDERLAQIRSLDERFRSLTTRVESVRERLQEIQQSERQAQEWLENLQKSLNQLRLIAQSNPFLAGIALSEIERAQRSAVELKETLSQPQRSSVEKKSRQVAAGLERLETAARRWLDQMQKENQAMHQDLERSLSELDAIARIEDGSVAEARRLLAAGLPQRAAPLAEKPAMPNLILQIKRHSDHWQECRAAQNALEDVQPLAETYREAVHQRKQVSDLASEIERSLQKRSWPPVSTSLERERQDWQRLETEWETLKQRSGKAISLVTQYVSLAARYQNLGERLRQSVDRQAQEMRQVEDLEEQIVALAEPWEALLAQYRDNPIASREIRGLLADIDEEMEGIERGYLRGELDYEEVVQQMRGLQRRVRFYQVALDDETALDASGRQIRRRQSERGGF